MWVFSLHEHVLTDSSFSADSSFCADGSFSAIAAFFCCVLCLAVRSLLTDVQLGDPITLNRI